MVGHGAKLNRKMEAAIAALMTHRSIEEAAKSVDIGTRTLMRWMKLPEFDSEYRKARRDGTPRSDLDIHRRVMQTLEIRSGK